MARALVTMTATLPDSTAPAQHQEFVTLRLGHQLFGIPVTLVRDVMHAQKIAPVPLAPPVIAGSLNVRGRIVTAFNMHRRLGLTSPAQPEKLMFVVVDYLHELFALMVESVGDVMSLPTARYEKVPTNMDENWRRVAAGVFKLENELLVILDIAHIIGIEKELA